MRDLEHGLRTAFERELSSLEAPSALAPSTFVRARRGKLLAEAAVATAAALALVAFATVGVNALREDPRPAAPPRSGTYIAIFPGGSIGWGSSKVTVDADEGRVCFDGGVYDSAAAYLLASSPPGADRGPAMTVATFYEGSDAPPKNACAALDPEVASHVIQEPEQYFLEFRRARHYALAPLRAVPETDAPPVAEVVCTDDGVEVLTPRVAAQPDGIHVRIDNRMSGSPKEFFLRDEEGGANQAGNIRPGLNEVEHHAAPGEMHVGCFDREEAPVYGLEGFGVVDVVDPAGLWNPPELACGEDVRERAVPTGEPYPETYGWEHPDYDELARRSLQGLLVGDELERPGYPATLWHFEPRTVVRDGERIAGLTFTRKADDTWVIRVRACPGSGIEGA